MKRRKFAAALLAASFVFTNCFTMSAIPAMAATETVSTTTSWNFSNSNFRSLGTISADTTVDNLTLKATSSKTMSIKSVSATVGSTSFSYALSLGGTGSASYRAIAVPVSGSTTLKVTAMSSGSSARTLNVAKADGTVIGTISCGTTAAVGSVTTDYSGTVYIYSTNSNIDVFKVQTDSKTTVTTADTTQASSTSWNFSNSNLRSLGTLSADTTVDNMTLKATSSKTMEVKAIDATVGSTSYTYALALGGTGSSSYRAIAVPASGTTTVKVTAASSGSSTRTLNVAKADGTVLGTISCGTSAAVGSATFSYTGTVYIYSANSGINVFKVQVDTGSSSSVTETTTQATTKTTTTAATTQTTTQKQTTSDTATSKTVTNFSDLVSAVKTLASTNGGGTVYVNASKIDCTAQLALSSTKGNPVKIVGVKQSDGTYPILDFETFRNNTIGSTGTSLKASGDSNVGVRISGSNYTLDHLIIQNAGDNGIQIKGSNAKNNTVDNCIVRYNNDAGVQITDGASNNTMRFVYSYRNCDVYTRGGNSDGFAPKLGATTGNTFYGCRAWDNSDDGWDSFDKTDSGYTYDLSYEECACWNNGNPDVFTGKYDYDNGDSLDTNLFLVKLISKQDSSFATNYKNKKFSLPSAAFIKTDSGTIKVSDWTGSKYDGNDNGFKFGSVNSKSNLTRYVKNCVSFDNGCKGFDNNNSSCTGSFQNCISFDNGYNYYLPPFTMSKWSNIKGFGGASKDKLPSGYSATTPSSSEQATIRSKTKATAAKIVASCNSNKIPDEILFDIFS
jgi:hypothetical protein